MVLGIPSVPVARKRPSIASLREKAGTWRDLLGLSDWTLYVAWGKPVTHEPDPKKRQISALCDGSTWWYTEDAGAIILLHPSCEDPVGTLVHELLHLRLEGHREMPAKYDALYERALNVIAEALVKNRS